MHVCGGQCSTAQSIALFGSARLLARTKVSYANLMILINFPFIFILDVTACSDFLKIDSKYKLNTGTKNILPRLTPFSIFMALDR